MLKGKFTIVAFNSVGFPYAWDTNIMEMKEEGNKIVIIHKPKGKRTAWKHTYDKDNELKIYKGWLEVDLTSNGMVSYDNASFNQISAEPIFSL